MAAGSCDWLPRGDLPGMSGHIGGLLAVGAGTFRSPNRVLVGLPLRTATLARRAGRTDAGLHDRTRLPGEAGLGRGLRADRGRAARPALPARRRSLRRA